MASVTYKNQPAIDLSGGSVPLAGNLHIYTVKRVLWPKDVEAWLSGLLMGRSLNVCCGKSLLCDVRLDLNEESADIKCDAANMKSFVADDEFDTVVCDPPYNGIFRWNHDLLSELARVARKRIIFQHWFIPARPDGTYKKARSKFRLTALYAWQPRTYFGRVQMVSIFDAPR